MSSVPTAPPPAPAASPPAKAAEAEPPHPPPPPVKFDPFAALLSYLVPGLGQVYQGRIGKGLLFFGGLYGLFFYGMAMGQWRNVWLPDTTGLPPMVVGGREFPGVPTALWYRPQFLGQFWIGTAAWPACVQYRYHDPNRKEGPIFKTFQREPAEEELNRLQRDGNKRWDLGWVYTVIAGVLNLLVIYDALAGPLFREYPKAEGQPGESPAAAAGPEPVPATGGPAA
jgi:hypothetical protein